MQKADPLIRTKMRLPLIRAGLVPRPRLQQQIAQGLRGPLTLITAPAGFGKTTAVAACVAGCGMPVAWLSLDRDDNQVERFLRYLVAALQAADEAIGSEAAQLLESSPPVPAEVVLTSLINDLDVAGREMALVLDDYHFISNQAVHGLVTGLLDHQPGSFHLVIATRADPPLPVARLRARSRTVELRAADLRFTEAEAVQFLNDVKGLGLDAGAVALLEERTEGWIAGLQMAALSMQGRDAEHVASLVRQFAGTHRFIMDFMLEEVLGREPEEVQTFLLQTAFLNRLCGPLCDAVTGTSGGQAMLEQLERRNLFVVPLDDERRWYRYHHLFADLLQARLHQSGRDRVAQLLSWAADWCEQVGQVGEAVSYALTAPDYERASDLVARHWGEAAGNGEIETVWSWLKALPEDTVRNSAPLSVACCWLLWLRGQVGAMEAPLLDAERALAESDVSHIPQGDAAEFAALPAQLAVLRSFVARYHNDMETARDLAERALSLVPAEVPPPVDAQLRSLICLALASACDGAGDLERAVDAYTETIRWSRLSASATGVAGITYRLVGALRVLGRLRAADAACREALVHMQAHGMARLPAAGILHVAMSEMLVERNELDAAEAHLAQGIELGKRSGRLDAVRNAAYVLSRLRLARQDADGALAAVREAEAASGEPLPPLASADLLALRARILVRRGALSEAARCAEEAVRLAGRDRGQAGAAVALAVARVHQARSKPDAAVAELTRSLAAAEASGRLGTAIELLILRSLARVRQGDTHAGEADLERALALGEPEGYVRIFVEEGEPMAQLLRRLASRPARSTESGGCSAEYLATLLAAFGAPGGRELPTGAERAGRSAALIEPLSERERQVLRLMAEGLTNEQIAARLIIALGTVKAHVHNISGKLGAQNRAHAVARARELDLL
jgi:LuxR family maltose regulon positive regulatory protein